MANTNCFLDYAGLELFWSKVKDVIENNELVTANAITNLDTRIDNLESTKSDIGHTHDDRYYTESEINDLLNTKSNTNHTHTFASLTSKPTTISGYGITDALTTSNYTSYTVKKDGTGATGTWGINITGNAATATNADKLGNIVADNYFKQRDAVFNSDWDGKYLWTLWDNHLYAADKRFAVTLTGTGATNLSYLFDGCFESSVPITEDQAVLHIKHPTAGNVWTEGLPYGNFYVVFYNSDAENVTGRVYCNYDGQGIGWHDLTATHVRPHVWELNNGYYQLSDLEITITKPASSVSIQLCQVLHEVTRSAGPDRAAVMSKYCKQKTNYDIEAAGFIKTGGTSSQFLKADGSVDSNTYSKSDHTHDDRYYTESEINDLLATKSNTNHTHTFASLTSKPTTISGYGITDALKIDGSNGTAAGVSALINKLSAGSSDPTDADYYICQYAGGGTTTTSYHRRPMSAMWNWIKAKTDTLYPTKSGSGATGTWGINITGNAATATKIGTSTVGSSIMPVYINQGTPTAISSFPEANLSWGGKNFAAGFGPIDAAMISDLGACRSMFAKAEGITVQYSRDGGATWVDYGCTDTQKTALFSVGQGIVIGGTTETGIDKSNYKSRVIVTTNLAGIYTSLNKIAIYVSTSGSTGSNVTIDARKKANVDASNDTWVTLADRVTLAGNSGWNIINIPSTTTYGNRSDQYQQIRFTFGVTSHASTVTYPGLSVSRIKMFGGVGWTTPSNMARNGHLYTYDASQNATFPAAITSTMFKKSGGTSSQFLKADGSVDSNTYSKSGHTHDDRYYTESEIDTKLATKSNTGHTHDFASLTSKPTTLAGYGITETDGYLNKISKSGNTLTITPKGGTAFTFTNTPLVSITYSELKSLRDAGKLVPGQQYRITDYKCTTSQPDTQSAVNRFDIIVTADSESVLNEEARAIHHAGDYYFANNDLNAWKIWYCLDNDLTRFSWADAVVTAIELNDNQITCTYAGTTVINGTTYYLWEGDASVLGGSYAATIVRNPDPNDNDEYQTLEISADKTTIVQEWLDNISRVFYSGNGKGVIYRMIDEFNNDIPYDFKNIQFKHPKDTTTYPDYYYTFANPEFGNDLSCDIGDKCYSNIIMEYYVGYKRKLNCIIFIGSNCYNNTFNVNCYNNAFGSSCYNNTFGNGCYGNALKSTCISNTFGDNCYNNTFGTSCKDNTFGNNCYSNTFGNSCSNNTVGNGCYSNTFNSYCSGNIFGIDCHNNTFDMEFSNNTVGNSCSNNTTGVDFMRNTFGNSCSNNSFGSEIFDNTFGSNCSNNVFGYDCSSNTFGSYCQYIKFASDSSASTKYDKYAYNHFGDGCKYILFKETAAPASSADNVQNYNFAQGLQGTSSAYLTIDGVRNRSYETKVAKNSNGERKIYCEADLIA